MSLDPSVIARLRCPKSGEKLVPAPAVLLSRLGAKEGFASESGTWFYPVEEGFPVITSDAAVAISDMELEWDSFYQEGDMPWDRGAPAPPLIEFIEGNGEITGKVFVPGCGRGHDARYLAKHGAEVIGLDISPTAVAEATKLAKAEAISGIEFVEGNLFALPKEMLEAFDWVVEHTCLSGLPPAYRPAYFEAIHSVLRPGAKVYAIWFIEPDMEAGESGPPFGVSKQDIAELAGDRFEILQEWVPNKVFEGREGTELVQILLKK